MLRRKSDESVTFHVHALQTHKAAVITGKWLAKPLSQAVLGSFLDQMNAEPGTVKKWGLADIGRVIVDGEETSFRRLAKEFARMDGEAVQLVIEFSEDPNQRRTNAHQNAVPPEYLGPSGQDAAGASVLLSILDDAISETRRESQGESS